MDNFHKKSDPQPRARREKNGAQRVFHSLEQRFLCPETRSMACSLLDARSIPTDVTESAIHQALMMGYMSGDPVDAQTFEILFEAVALNPSFQISLKADPLSAHRGPWVC